MANGVKDLKLWQEAVALGGETLRAVRQHGRRETRAFTDRLILEGASVAAAIGEGHGSATAARQLPIFERAMCSLLALEADIAMGRIAGLLPDGTAAALTQRIAVVMRLLNGYIVYVERQAAQEALPGSSGAAPPPPAGKALDEVDTAQAAE